MKRIRKIMAAVLAVVLVCCGCGNIRSAERVIESPEPYSIAAVKSAMRVAEGYFFSNFSGSTLLEIRYDEEKTLKEMERHKERGENENVIVLTSSFYVDKSDGSLTPGTTYNGWSWELERTLLGTWKLSDAGYA